MRNVQQAAYLKVRAEVRYWKDATVNGEEDTDGKLIPFRNGDLWEPLIRLGDGQIMDWPEGTSADIHYKVCDAGEYFLLDSNKKIIRKYADYYVPDDLLCIGDTGYGDYIILKIDQYGYIEGWKKPALESMMWNDVEGDSKNRRVR